MVLLRLRKICKISVPQANAEVKETLELEIRRVFAEHNLGDVGTHTLCDDEVRILVNRVCARFNDLKMDYNHSKVKKLGFWVS
jgi:hypothetical protein